MVCRPRKSPRSSPSWNRSNTSCASGGEGNEAVHDRHHIEVPGRTGARRKGSPAPRLHDVTGHRGTGMKQRDLVVWTSIVGAMSCAVLLFLSDWYWLPWSLFFLCQLIAMFHKDPRFD